MNVLFKISKITKTKIIFILSIYIFFILNTNKDFALGN